MNSLEIEIGDTVKIVETSQYYNNGAANPRCEGVTIKPRVPRFDYRVQWNNGATNSYNLHDLTLIKKGKTMQFTKSDLKTGMFVRYRNGDYRVVIGDCLSGDGCAALPQYSEDLKYKGITIMALDIMAVYKAANGTNISEYLSGHCLTLIWERTEQTEAQKEMEVLQEQAKALQEQITKLQGTL
jgi:hypothetical protein